MVAMIKTVTAGGKRFKIGQVVHSRLSDGEIDWVIDGVIPDTYRVGRHRNILTVHRLDRPGIINTIDPKDIVQ